MSNPNKISNRKPLGDININQINTDVKSKNVEKEQGKGNFLSLLTNTKAFNILFKKSPPSPVQYAKISLGEKLNNKKIDFVDFAKVMLTHDDIWINSPVAKGLIGTNIDVKPKKTTTIEIDTKTNQVVDDLKEEKIENSENNKIEKNDIKTEKYDVSAQFFIDFPRTPAYIVGDTVIDSQGNTKKALPQFIQACTSMGCTPENIKTLSAVLNQSLAGGMFQANVDNSIPPKGVVKSFDMKDNTIVYTLTKSNKDEITITFQQKGALKFPMGDCNAGNSNLYWGLKASLNVKDGSLTCKGAYADIDPPLNTKDIKNAEKIASEENVNVNKGTINDSINKLKLKDAMNNKVKLHDKQKQMIGYQLNQLYIKKFGETWLTCHIPMGTVMDDIDAILKNLQKDRKSVV